MPETSEPQKTKPEESTTHAQPQGTDGFLGVLVDLAERGLSTSITLLVGGTAISGVTISAQMYLEEFSATWNDAQARAESKANGEEAEFNPFRDALAMEENEEDKDKPPAYIHLRDARVVTPGGQMPSGGSLWRGKLASVDGFFQGQFAVAL